MPPATPSRGSGTVPDLGKFRKFIVAVSEWLQALVIGEVRGDSWDPDAPEEALREDRPSAFLRPAKLSG